MASRAPARGGPIELGQRRDPDRRQVVAPAAIGRQANRRPALQPPFHRRHTVVHAETLSADERRDLLELVGPRAFEQVEREGRRGSSAGAPTG